MTVEQAVSSKLHERKYKPSVLIVQSPHHGSATQQDLSAKLSELDGLTYIRSLFIAKMACMLGMESPTYIYCDGWLPPDVPHYNRFLSSLAGQLKAKLQLLAGQNEPSKQLTPAEFMSQIPPREWYTHMLLMQNGNRYTVSEKNLRERVRPEWLRLMEQEGIPVETGKIDLARFEHERIFSMLAYAIAGGADITLRPGEFDVELVSKSVAAERRGEESLENQFCSERDDNLFAHVVDDFKTQKVKSAIVYFGNEHKLVKFKTTGDFAVYWAVFSRGSPGRVNLDAFLPINPQLADPLSLVKYELAIETLLQTADTKVRVKLY